MLMSLLGTRHDGCYLGGVSKEQETVYGKMGFEELCVVILLIKSYGGLQRASKTDHL